MSKYRKRVRELVCKSHDHPTAEHIYETLKLDYPSVVLATVYNNINRLCEDGEICRVSMPGTADRYDRPERHDHLICSGCGSLTDVMLNDLKPLLEREIGTDIESYDLKIHYLCPECRKKQQKK